MLKKICLLLSLCLLLPLLVSAEQTENKNANEAETPGKDAITIVGGITPKAGEGGLMVFAGQVINNTKDLLHSVEIVFEVLDSEENIMDTVTAPIEAKEEGILEGGETGFFEVRTTVHISTAGSYKYNISWKTFGGKKEDSGQ